MTRGPAPKAMYEALPTRELEVEGHRVHFVDVGAGPAIVLVHGSPVSSFSFRHAITALSATHRVLAPDLVGFGRSSIPHEGADFTLQARVLRAWLDAVEPGPITLLGHDWGGPVVMAVAARRPGQVERLILVNTTVTPDFTPPRYWRPFISWGVGDLLVVRGNLVARGLRALLGAAWTREVRRTYQKTLASRGARRTVLRLERQEGFRDLMEEVRTALPALRVPTLILWGHPDPYFRTDELERLAALLDHAEVRTLDGAGHFPQEDAAEAFTDALLAFLAPDPP